MTYEIWRNLVTAWENFENAPSHETARALVEAINVPVDVSLAC
jgi:hypothetical protein